MSEETNCVHPEWADVRDLDNMSQGCLLCVRAARDMVIREAAEAEERTRAVNARLAQAELELDEALAEVRTLACERDIAEAKNQQSEHLLALARAEGAGLREALTAIRDGTLPDLYGPDTFAGRALSASPQAALAAEVLEAAERRERAGAAAKAHRCDVCEHGDLCEPGGKLGSEEWRLLDLEGEAVRALRDWKEAPRG